MGIALGWVVFALAGVGAAPPTDRNEIQIKYTVQYMETEGLGWREAVFAQLKPVARQGGATVWTASQAVANRVRAEVTRNPAGKIRQTPNVVAFNGAPVHIASRSNHPLVTQVSWSGEDQAASPAVEQVRTGWLATMVGRRLDQGVLVQLVFEDTEISAIHNVKISDSCAAGHGKAASAWVPKPASVPSAATIDTGVAESPVFAGTGSCAGLCAYAYQFGANDVNRAGAAPMIARRTGGAADTDCSEEKCSKAQGCCESADEGPFKEDAAVQQLRVQVPEIRTQEVAGEWLIPKDELLLVSFGVYTTADQNGKAVVKERLAMIRAEEVAGGSNGDRTGRMAHFPIAPKVGPAAVQGPTIPAPAPLIAPPPVVVPARPINPFSLDWGQHAVERGPLTVPALPANPAMPLPVAPSRTMPQGVHGDGTISNLPPLPDETEQSTSESAEPMASPQTKKHQQAKPATDSGAAKASFAPGKVAALSIPSLFLPGVPSSPAGLQFLLPIKPFSFKLPFKQRLEIEIFGRLVPDIEPSSKPSVPSE